MEVLFKGFTSPDPDQDKAVTEVITDMLRNENN